MRKKLFSILLSLAMVITMMPAMSMTAYASANVDTWQDLQSAITGGTGAVKIELTGNLTASSADSAITVGTGKTATIDLKGHTINRNLSEATANGFVIQVEGNLTIKDSTSGGKITGGHQVSGSKEGGGVHVASGGAFTMTGGSIVDNKATIGGGVYVNSGTFNMSGGNITCNTATTNGGGGVYVIHEGGTFNMSGGSIVHNNSSADGGGVKVMTDGTFNMTGGNITGNTAATNGGGVYYQSSNTFAMSGNSKIEKNKATQSGGGVYVGAGSFTMTGGEITGNNAVNGRTAGTSVVFGGGVLFSANGTFTLGGTAKITDNVKDGEIIGDELSGGAANNVYLVNKKITIGNGTDAPKTGMTVGVTTYPAPTDGNPKQFTTNGKEDDKQYFFSDSPEYYVNYNSEHLELKAPAARNHAINIIPSAHGSVSAPLNEASAGTIVTLTVTPASGYELSANSLEVTSADGTIIPVSADSGNTYTFTMPSSAVKVTATFVKKPEPAKTTVSLLRAYKSGSKNVKLTWNKVSGATKYVVYGSRCGYKYKKIKTVSGTKYTVKKIGKKKIKAHRTYKFYVVAYKGNKKLIKSNNIHYITANTMGRYANVKSIKPKNSEIFLSVKGTQKISATKTMYKNKKHVRTSHGAATRYITNNPSVATVSKSGVVKGIRTGTATIYTQDIGGRYCKTVVTVIVPVEKVVLEATSDAIEVAEKKQLCATVLPENATNKNLVWESSDEDVVTVDEKGVITGIVDGTATITTKSVSNPTIKATCEVRVSGGCFAEGTLITMADGKKRAVENLNRGDDIVTFDHETGEKSYSSIVDYYKYEENSSKAMTLHFSDNFDVTVVMGHAFYDKSLNKYVDITVKNVEKYIGHEFFCMENMSWKTLNGYTQLNDKKDSYVVVTKNHLNCVANGMLSNEDDLYSKIANVFEFDDNMKIDQDKKKADIQKYGLWTYDDIEYLTEEAFDGLNLKYLGILVGKGIITKDEIEERGSYVPEFDPEIVVPEKRND